MSVNQESVKIGKNIIEVLTTGMYKNPLIVYREYIQNGADQIDRAVEEGVLSHRDEGLMNISIDSRNRCISIDDNATGIPRERAWELLTNVAASEKDRLTNKGFRGIGRLGGLAYCDELIFETSYPGEEIKTRITWDCKKLKSILSNRNDSRFAHDVIKDVTYLEDSESERSDEHYFRVIMNNVTNDELLNEDRVVEYLSMIAPVSLNKTQFLFHEKIYSKFRELNIAIDEYRIHINEDVLTKGYGRSIYKLFGKHKKKVADVIDICFEEFKKDGELMAAGWYAVTDPLETITEVNYFRGIRLRKGNIQIGGDEDPPLQQFFSESRFHNYFIGEIHVSSDTLIPNARRDYFDESEGRRCFEDKIKKFCYTLNGFARDSSFLSAYEKSKRDIIDLEEKQREKNETGTFISENEREYLAKEIENKHEELRKKENRFKKIKEKHNDDSLVGKILNRRETESPSLFSPSDTGQKEDNEEDGINPYRKKRDNYITSKLAKLNKKEQKLVSEIFTIINDVLPSIHADTLIKKIIEQYR